MVRIAGHAILNGDIIGMPTETVYGLAAHGLNPDALIQVFRAKERPLFDPLILHIAPSMRSQLDKMGITQMSALSVAQRDQAQLLMERFWPGPLTLVLPRGPKVPDLVTSGLDSVAIRMPNHPVAQHLIDAVGAPLAAPSANRFGRISPTSAQDVMEELGSRIPYIIDGGPCEVGVESTVLAILPGHPPTLLRPGGIPPAEIEKILGEPVHRPSPEKATASPLQSPGQLPSHYAPRTPLKVSDTILMLGASIRPGTRVALLSMFTDPKTLQKDLEARDLQVVASEQLSSHKSLEEAAQRLFASLRKLDASGAQIILAEGINDTSGLGLAIQDRLQRAAAG